MANDRASSVDAYNQLRQLWIDHSDELMGRAVDLDASPAGAMQVTEDAYVEVFKAWKREGGSLGQLEAYIDEHAAGFAEHELVPSGWRGVSERCREVVWFERPRWITVAAIAGVLLLVGALFLTAFGNDDDPLDDLDDVLISTSVPAATTTTVPATTTTAFPIPDDLRDDAVDLRGQDVVEIDVTDNAFGPRDIIVAPGTEIVFTNQGQNEHNVKPAVEGQFETIETQQLLPDASASRVFAEPGDYPYFCSIHGTANRGQRGRIVVS